MGFHTYRESTTPAAHAAPRYTAPMQRRAFLGTPLLAPALFARLREAIGELDLISTHEHLLSEQERYASQPDFFVLADHYAINDVVSAGMPADTLVQLRDRRSTAAARWRLFEPWWRHARFTGYGQALRIAVRDLYGIAEVSADNAEQLNGAIAAANKPGLYRDILKRRMKLKYGVLDDYWRGEPVRPDPEYFRLARKFDWFCTPANAAAVKRMEEVTGVSITSLDGLVAALERRFQQSREAGLAAVKSTIAYQREILFANPSKTEAAAAFDALMRGNTAARRPLEDYMYRQVLGLAESHGLPFQIHTGIQAGNSNVIANTRPMLAANLLRDYPGLRFDLFHTGWPWPNEVMAMAKMFPNAYADFCWTHILSPASARQALDEMIGAVPSNKILGFGGDYRHVELTYAHSVIARDNIARVLAARVEEKEIGEDEALGLARAFLYDNPATLFGP